MIRKATVFLFGLLLLGIPFEGHRFKIFRPFSRSLLHKFEAICPFDLILPQYFEKYIHFYFSDLIIVLIVFLMMASVRFRDLTWAKSSKHLTIFWAIALVSLPLSLFSRYYFQYFNLLNLGIIFLGFHVTRLFFQGKRDMMKTLFWGVAVISSFECFVGLWQFFTQGPLGVFALGELPLHLNRENLAVIPLTEQTRKLVELFHPIPEGRTLLLRAYGTFIHPNVFGEYLVISLMISYFLFSETRKWFEQVGLGFLILSQVFCLCLTFSRAGLASWGVGTLIWFTLLFSKRVPIEKEKKKRAGILATILGCSFLFTLIILLPHLLARGGILNWNGFVQASDTGRMIYNQIAFGIIKAHPLLGIGYNCFTIAPSEFFPGPDVYSWRSWAHNVYLLIAAETGVIGLGCFLVFLFSLIRPFFKQTLTLISITLLAIFVGFLLIGLFDFYFLIVQSGKLMFFLFSGMLAAQRVSAHSQTPSQAVTKATALPRSSQSK